MVIANIKNLQYPCLSASIIPITLEYNVLKIFVNVSDKTIHLTTPSADGTGEDKISLPSYSLKLIRTN